jgi:hypothetical protein
VTQLPIPPTLPSAVSYRTQLTIGEEGRPGTLVQPCCGYNAHPAEQMSHHLTMLAFDLNDESLTFGPRALRLKQSL